MKIDGVGSSGSTTGLTRSTNSRPASSGQQPAETAEVRLSAVSAVLATGSGESVVDLGKVQEIRQAIAEGRFQINPGAIADRLIATARELVASQRQA